MSFSSTVRAVPAEERFSLSNVVKFKLNTSGVSGDDVISARLGVYVRKLSSLSSTRQQRWRSRNGQRSRRVFPLVRVHVSDVTWRQQVHGLRRRTVYNVDYQGQWIMFEVNRHSFIHRLRQGG